MQIRNFKDYFSGCYRDGSVVKSKYKSWEDLSSIPHTIFGSSQLLITQLQFNAILWTQEKKFTWLYLYPDTYIDGNKPIMKKRSID